MLEQSLMDRLLAEQSQIRENYLRYLTGRTDSRAFSSSVSGKPVASKLSYLRQFG